MSVKSKHSTSKKSGKKEKKKKESDYEFESSEEELDLTKECHPIGYYINDRAEMINQMFSVIKKNKLKAMLPPCLKDSDIDQLKLQCLDQLLGMSEKRITCILEGEPLDASSESEVAESDEFDSDEKNQTDSSSSSNKSHYSQEDGYTNNVNHRNKKRKGGSVSGGKSGKAAKTESESGQPEQGKTLLEILELEMRARAIRALLKQSGNETKAGDADKNGVKEDTGEVVDLTECEEEEFPKVVKKEKTPESEIDLKVSTFEEKVEKTKKEKTNSSQEGEKSKRLQAELELRNKLFKKKIYRTRQQRMESEEESKNTEENKDELENDTEPKSVNNGGVKDIVIKQEPIESEEIVIEDPEEGEIDTSEDEYPVEIKQEPEEEPPVPEPEITDEPMCPNFEDFDRKLDEDAEIVTAIDNGTFVNIRNVDNMTVHSMQKKEEPPVDKEKEQITESGECSGVKNQDNSSCDVLEKEEMVGESNELEKDKGIVDELQDIERETSWRDRWLQKGEVQKLVKSSKIFAKVKKRIVEKSHRAKEELSNSLETNSDSVSNSGEDVIIGSIKEYERLLRKTPVSLKENHLGEGENSQESADNTKAIVDEKT